MDVGTGVQAYHRHRVGVDRRPALALAARAERRPPEIDVVRRDEPLPALYARLATAAVHLQLELESPGLTRPGAVIAHRGPRRVYGAQQHVCHGRVQAGELVQGQLVGGLGRVDSGLEQRLVRVDIAHPRDAALVHDRLLDRGARPLEPLGEHERRERLLERLWVATGGIATPNPFVAAPHRVHAAHIAGHAFTGL